MEEPITELEVIINIVEDVFGVDIRTTCRKRIYINARACYFYLAKKYTTRTLDKIGSAVGVNHATVINGLVKLQTYKRYDGFENLHKEAVISAMKVFIKSDKNTSMKEKTEIDFVNHFAFIAEVRRKKNERLMQILLSDQFAKAKHIMSDLEEEDIEELIDSRLMPFVKMKLNQKQRYRETYGRLNLSA